VGIPQDLSGLDRNPTFDAQVLANKFNPQKIADNQQAGMLAGQVGMTAAGDAEHTLKLDNGTAGAIALHTVAGGAIAALGGGNALGGALGAGTSEAAIPYLTSYGNNGVLAGTTLIGALVGGGAGASTALAGTQYNYLTHQQLVALQKKVDQCGSDQVCVQSAKSDAEIVSAKQQQQLDSDCGGSAGGFSSACNANIPDAFAYATDPLAAKLGLQVDQYITTQDYLSHRSEWGVTVANNAVNNDGKMMLAVPLAAIAAALGGAPAAGVLAEDGAAGSTGAIWQFLFASRGGAATTSGAINLGGLLYRNGGDFSQVNYIDVGASTASGYLSYGGNVVLNGLVGTSVGMVQTEANNLYYNQNKSLLVGGLTGGGASMACYMVGSGVSSSMQTPVFTPVSSVIWGNVVGAGSTEGANLIFEKINAAQNAQQKVGQ
jgi:filamentous hemagglutinin